MRMVDASGQALSKLADVGHYGQKNYGAMEGALSDSARSAGIYDAQKLKAIYVRVVGHRRYRAFGQMQR